MRERHTTWTTEVGGRKSRAFRNGCEELPDLLGIRSTARLNAEHCVQKSYDLRITSLIDQLIQPFEHCRHNLWLVKMTLLVGVCFYSAIEEFLKRLLFVDIEYLGKDACERENVA